MTSDYAGGFIAGWRHAFAKIRSNVKLDDDTMSVIQLFGRVGLVHRNLFGLPKDAEQQWFDEVQEIVCDFVQNDERLGRLMLDGSPRYWEECLEKGLTPQQALDRFINRLSGDAL